MECYHILDSLVVECCLASSSSSFFISKEKGVVQFSCVALFICIGLRVFMQIINLDLVSGLITPVHSLMLSRVYLCIRLG